MSNTVLDKYTSMMPSIFEAVSSAVGSQVMLLVLDRSLWKTKVSHPEADRISFTEEGISLEGLYGLESAKTEQIVSDFVLSIIETLSRLVGIQIAEKLTEGLMNSTKGEEE